MGPTLHLLAGIVVLGEPFGRTKVIGYALIWLAFAWASVDVLAQSRRA